MGARKSGIVISILIPKNPGGSQNFWERDWVVIKTCLWGIELWPAHLRLSFLSVFVRERVGEGEREVEVDTDRETERERETEIYLL